MDDETTTQAPLEPEPEQGAETAPAQEDGMAKKSAGKKAAKPRKAKAERKAAKPRAEKKAKAPREAAGIRAGKGGSVVVIAQAIEFVVRGLKLLLKDGSLKDAEQPVVERLLARAESRL